MVLRGSFSIRLSRVGLALAASGLLGAGSLGAQPRIEHDDVRCFSPERFTELVADIQPPEQVRSAKVYFRSVLYPEFYFVEMTASSVAPNFQAVLPLPTKETTRVVYYIEAVDLSFQTARSRDYEVSIESVCRPGPGGLFFPGTDPGIVIGATRAGAAALPAGFQATGVTGFISAAGGAAAGGGIGTAVAIGAAAGAAAGVGIVVATGGEDSGTGGGGPTGGITTTTAVEGSGSGGPTTTTAPGGSGSSSTTTSPSGPTTTTVPSGPNPPPSTTTAPPTLQACFRWEALGNCTVRFESCSIPASEIERYEWRMLGPPVPDPPETESFTFDFNADPRCRDTMEFNRPVRLTVYDGAGRSDSIQENVNVISGSTYRATRFPSTTLRFGTFLTASAPDGAVRAQVLVDGRPLAPVGNGQPVPLEARVSSGAVAIVGMLLTPAPPGSYWELDFATSDRFVPGSLRVEQGAVAGASDRRVVLRLSGEAGETVRLRLEVR